MLVYFLRILKIPLPKFLSILRSPNLHTDKKRRNVNFSVPTYNYENFFLTLTWRIYENWMLRRIFGLKRENVPGECWELRSEEIIKCPLLIALVGWSNQGEKDNGTQNRKVGVMKQIHINYKIWKKNTERLE